jgi:hypothetical protein
VSLWPACWNNWTRVMYMSKFRDLGIATSIPVKFLTFGDSNMAAVRNCRLQVRINTAAIQHRSLNWNYKVGRESLVGIATRCGLGGPGIESRWSWDSQLPSRPVLALNQPTVTWVTGFFPWGNVVAAWPQPPIPSSVKVEERVELYLHSLSGPSYPSVLSFIWRSKQDGRLWIDTVISLDNG